MRISKNKVFIAASIDGYIADRNGSIEWLNDIENPEGLDLGFIPFMKQIDAIVMGRNTFDVVCGFDVDWPYAVPVFVLSSTIKQLSPEWDGKVQLLKGPVNEIVSTINKLGYHRLYIDGGRTIQQFLESDCIDELIITTIPVVLGGGFPLFSKLPEALHFELKESQVLLNQLVQSSYKRKR